MWQWKSVLLQFSQVFNYLIYSTDQNLDLINKSPLQPVWWVFPFIILPLNLDLVTYNLKCFQLKMQMNRYIVNVQCTCSCGTYKFLEDMRMLDSTMSATSYSLSLCWYVHGKMKYYAHHTPLLCILRMLCTIQQVAVIMHNNSNNIYLSVWYVLLICS